MSEPVGNSPRGTAIPDNSHKNREQPAPVAPPVEAKEAQTKIVEGKVTTRKSSWWKRAAHSMIADDSTSIREYVVAEVIVPAVRNLIRDSIVGVTERTLYGSVRRRGGVVVGSARDSGPVSSLRTRYDRVAEERPRELGREQRARHDFSQIILDSHEEATSVVEALIERVVRYGAASVTDLYDAVGVTGSFADQRWGWTDLATADIRPYRGGWLIDLPAPAPLTR